MRLPFFGGARREAELEEEIRSHLEMAVRERVARGEDPVEAERAARREFGSIVVVKEVTRRQWAGASLERGFREARQALRGLVRAPGFAGTAVLILGVGIGMATVMFVVADAVLVRPLPVVAADRLVLPRTLDPGGVDVGMTQEELKRLGEGSRTMTAVAGVAHQGAFTVAAVDGERTLALRAAWVTGDFFDVLGVRPALGRLFDARDEVQMGSAGDGAPVVLSYGAWQREFGGDSSVVGRRLGDPYTHASSTIVGVAPPGLAYPAGTEYWTPRVYPILDVVARLAPGATPAMARTEFLSIMREIDRRRIAAGRQGAQIASADVEAFTHAVLGDVRPQILVLVAAVALLLMIAAANVGNLVLLRATTREAEMAVRRSLGARTADIVRPVLLESVALAVGGGLLGLALAHALLAALTRVASPADLPRLDVVRVGAAPLGVAAAVTLGALLIAGLFPTVAAAHAGLAASLRLDARAGRGGGGRRRLRQTLVASQIALALVMLAGAGLLVRSLERLAHVPLGYRPEHLSVLSLATPVNPDSAMSTFVALYERVAPALRALPDVVSVTPIAIEPFYGAQVFTARWAAAGQTDAEAAANPLIPFEVGGTDYFRTFGIPLYRGRAFLPTDRGGAPRVAVVSRAVAARFWPGENPVGKQIRLVGETGADRWLTVVGEAGDIRYRALRRATPTIYVPWRQFFFQGVVAIRTRAPLAALLPALRDAVRSADPEATVARAESMSELVGRQLALPRLATLVLSGFGAAALLLAAIGLYGVMAAAVRERTHELGVRAALGATPGRLRREVLQQAALIAVAGAAVGVAAALVASRFLRSLLFQVTPADPVALAGAAALLLAVALIAAYVPAWRATRADPARALRAE